MKIDFDINQEELLTLLKLMNRAVAHTDLMSHFNEDECELLSFFLDELQGHALEHGI